MKIVSAIVLLFLCTGAVAQSHRDPLTDREVNQMRDSAQDPKKRVELLIGFSKERMQAIESLRVAAKPCTEGQIADLLSDLATLIDEMDDNIAMYNGHSEDLRHPLRQVLDVEAEMQQKLAALSESATPLRKRRIAAALEDATDSLTSSTESARAMLADQLQKKGEEKTKDKSEHQAKRGNGTEGGDYQPPPDYTGMGGAGQKPR
jgi:hypothetical protein